MRCKGSRKRHRDQGNETIKDKNGIIEIRRAMKKETKITTEKKVIKVVPERRWDTNPVIRTNGKTDKTKQKRSKS